MTFFDSYDDHPPVLDEARKNGVLTLTMEPYTDKWGTCLSAFLPVKDPSGRVYAVIAADYDISDVQMLSDTAECLVIQEPGRDVEDAQ